MVRPRLTLLDRLVTVLHTRFTQDDTLRPVALGKSRGSLNTNLSGMQMPFRQMCLRGYLGSTQPTARASWVVAAAI